MRRRITRTLFTVAVAGASATTLVLTAAGAASAAPTAKASHTTSTSGGAPIYSAPCSSFQMVYNLGGCSGYVASGRNFRFAQSLITMPAIPGDITSPIRFIALGSADNIASAGLISCDVALNLFAYTCPGGDTYAAFAATAQQSFIFFSHFIPLSVATGDGVFFSIYDDRVGNELHFVITLPDGTSSAFGVDAHGADYTMAAAMANWSGSTPDSPAQPSANFRLGQFLQGRFTTVSGQRGTFTGPWTLNPIKATSNGSAPPLGTLTSAPAYLWTDGNSFKQQFGDAFGVWLYT